MSRTILIGSRRVSPVTLLLALLGIAIGAALLTPELETGGGFSSYSNGPGGLRMMYELARRMGWSAGRRETVLDSLPPRPNTQVVVGPNGSLGAHEVHLLLENVRRGGGLIFAVNAAPEIADSLGIILKSKDRMLGVRRDSTCRTSESVFERPTRSFPPMVDDIGWRRPAPGPVAALSAADAAVGFPLGGGRVAAISTTDVFENSVIRVCEWGADLPVARALEYVRPPGASPVIVFDEFHHGYGVHGGSLTAVWMFLSRTASGHFLAQALIAALVLLFAAAPRPIVPQDPERIIRRSPLEHADALGRAYSDVQATRTATSRLVSGLRRRAGRTVAIEPKASERDFLDAVVRRSPSLEPRVATVKRALDHGMESRELIPVGEAIAQIEQVLLNSPPTTS